MAFKVPHVRPRDGVFYYERRVPVDVVRDLTAFATFFNSQSLYRRSLHTKDRAAVLPVAAQERTKFEDLLGRARGKLLHPVVGVQSRPRTMDSEVLRQIADDHHRTTVTPWREAFVLAELGGEHAAELERLRDEREMDATAIRDALLHPGRDSQSAFVRSPMTLAREAIQQWDLDVAEGSSDFALLTAAVRKGVLAGQRNIDLMLEGRGTPVIPPRRSLSPKSITIRETVERYLKDKAVRPKTAAEIRTSLRMFELVIGNRELQTLGRSDFQRFLNEIGAKVVGGRSEGSVRRPISEGTIKKRLGFIRTAINHAIDKGWFEGANPAAGFNVSAWVTPANKAVTPDKRGFKVQELNRVFSHPWFTGCHSLKRNAEPGAYRLSGAHYWAPVVALMTGCRAAELGGLMIKEIDLESPHPHIVIRDNQYRPTKGGYARSVPILDALLRLGFADYVERVKQSDSDRLFPDWISPRRSVDFRADDAGWANAGIIRSFNRNVVVWALGASMVEGARREVTFHGFRGAFKAMLGLTQHRVPANVINEVLGHSKSEMDGRYIGEIPIEETHPAVRGCMYAGLLLPSPFAHQS